MADIKKFKFWTQKVLPAVYDDSLSYYEVLCKVVEYLNEVIEVCNTFDTDVSELQAAVARLNEITEQLQTEMQSFEQRFATLEAELDAKIDAEITSKTAQLTRDIEAEIARLNAEVASEISRLDAEVTAALAEVRRVVDSLDEHIDAEVAEMKAEIRAELDAITEQLDEYDEYINDRFTVLQKYIDDQFEELKRQIPEFENVMVVNPHTTKLENIQTVVNELYDLDRSDAIRAVEFDKLGLTCGELDKYIVYYIPRGLTALEWDYKSKHMFASILDRTYSIVTGELVNRDYNMMVLEKGLKQSGSYSATEWDTVGKTADEFDNLSISCYNIDWRSNSLVA